MNKKTIAGIVGVIVIAGGSYFLGTMHIGKSAAGVRGGQFTAGQFSNTRGLAGARAGTTTTGEILSKDATSVTVALPDGSTKIVLLGPSALIVKTVPGTDADLTTGTPVSVIGSTNSDGSLTAQSIQIREASTTRPQ